MFSHLNKSSKAMIIRNGTRLLTCGSDGVEGREERVVLQRGRPFGLEQGRQGFGIPDGVTLERRDEVFGFLRRLPLRVGQGEVDQRHLSLSVLCPRVAVHPARKGSVLKGKTP